MQTRALLLGTGNILLQDEGLGVWGLEYLQSHYDVPPQVLCVDGGVMGLDLLPIIESHTHILIIDAVEAGLQPGTLVRLDGDALYRSLSQKLSIHQLGLLEVLGSSLLLGTAPQQVVLWGMQPASLDWGVGLTSMVSAQIPALVESVICELSGWGLNVALHHGNFGDIYSCGIPASA